MNVFVDVFRCLDWGRFWSSPIIDLCNFVIEQIIIKYKSYVLSHFSFILLSWVFLYLTPHFYVVTLNALTLFSTFPPHTMTLTIVFFAMTLLAFASWTRISFWNHCYSRHFVIATVSAGTLLGASSPCLETLTVVFLAFCFGTVALYYFFWCIICNFLFNWWFGLNCGVEDGRGDGLIVIFQWLLFCHFRLSDELVVEVSRVDVFWGKMIFINEQE